MYNYELILTKEDTPLIKNDGEFLIVVTLEGEVTGGIEKGYVNKFGDKEEPDSDDREVSIYRVIIPDHGDLVELYEQSGCNNIRDLHKFILNYDYSEIKEVQDYYFGLQNLRL